MSINESSATQSILSGEITMRDVLVHFPGAQRALFAKYHIGGCQSCGFSPTETLAEVCARNEEIPVDEAIAHIESSAASDEKLLLSPGQLDEKMKQNSSLALLDVRTREEHEAVAIAGSRLMTQDVIQEAFMNWDKEREIVLIDHTGTKVLDSVAYFVGHGFVGAKGLDGGIDAYSREVDAKLPRYRVELD